MQRGLRRKQEQHEQQLVAVEREVEPAIGGDKSGGENSSLAFPVVRRGRGLLTLARETL
jgi:hypothetical protein